MADGAIGTSEELRRALATPSARRKALPLSDSARRAVVVEGEDGQQPIGRYDGRRAPLPLGDKLATSAREENRAVMEKQLKRLRGAVRAQAAAGKAAETPGKRLKAMEAREHLEAEVARLQETIAVIGETVAVAGVDDPLGDGKRLIKVVVNKRVDVLEDERSRRLITEGAYRTGRIVQAVFDRMGRVGGSNWCGASRVDAALATEIKMIRALQDAETVGDLMARIRDRLGDIDTRLLRRILGERLSYGDCAALQAKSGDRGQRYVASRYRDAFEELTAAWTFRGAARPAPDDKHADAAAAMVERQDAAVIGGATLGRLLAELRALEAGEPIAVGLVRQVEIERRQEAIAALRLRQSLARERRAAPPRG